MFIFNKEKQRMEPTETKCQYCDGVEQSTNMDDNYFIPMFRENDRTNIVVYRSVKYSKLPVGIPRCKSCLKIHEEAASKGALIAWSIAAAIILLGFLLFGFAGIFGIFIGLFIGFYGTEKIEEKLVGEKGIFTKKDGAEFNAEVQLFLVDGWSFTQPTA